MSLCEILKLMDKYAAELYMTQLEHQWVKITINNSRSCYKNYLLNNFAPLLYAKFPFQP